MLVEPSYATCAAGVASGVHTFYFLQFVRYLKVQIFNKIDLYTQFFEQNVVF